MDDCWPGGAEGDECEAMLSRRRAPATAFPIAAAAWQRTHSSDRTFVLRAGSPVAAGAAITLRHARGLVIAEPCAEPGTVVGVDAVDPAAADLLVDALRSHLNGLGRPWVLRLGLLPGDSPMLAALRRRLPDLHVSEGPGVPRLDVSATATSQLRLSPNTTGAEARTRNRARRDGLSLVTTWHHANPTVDDRLNEIMAVHRRRNRQLRGYAGLDDRRAAAHFELVVRLHAEAGRLDVLTVDLDGRLAAFAVCLRGGGNAMVYANLADPDALAYGAGTYANAAVVRHFLKQPWCELLDWGPGVQRYKLSGGAQVAATVTVEACSNPTVRRALAMWRHARRARAAVARWPRRTTPGVTPSRP